MPTIHSEDFPGGSAGKESTCNVGDLGSIPGLGGFARERNGNPLQYSCLENAMDRGAWRATVQGVTKSRTRLSDLRFHFSLVKVKCFTMIHADKRENEQVLVFRIGHLIH